MAHATGEFEVKMTPHPAEDESGIGRYTIDKKFQGDLEGTSRLEMLAVGTAVEGSAGYVAMEKVNATLLGLTGAFALQHTGTMSRGTAQLSVSVVPDSGTGELEGLTGHMTIKVEGARHSYVFEYSVDQR
jgi:hypothetical protein